MKTQNRTGAGKALGASVFVALVAVSFNSIGSPRLPVPAPKLDTPLAAGPVQTAVFSGGCFWGVEAVFEHVKGVRDVTSGYSGGSAATANYETVSGGQTGHAESVRVRFDPSVVSYGQLLDVFFAAAHDPTQLNRQSPDHGTQYRSAVFTTSPAQQRIAAAYIAQLDAAKVFGSDRIVTQVAPLKAFYPAESYHQDFARLNPDYPYIVVNDAPKVVRLKQVLPRLYRNQWSVQLAQVAR